ncbi:DUF58 domain-containing protein [Paracoccus aerodenitrificans]|uniref:DUF58 domain-containing protein n=1 Tax=Paracoccus aerodenitrificans TaxID=3017781 RepID=UPI0022F10B56|nr:DUF58 domain-containing protein [Paracoccus aerodenitrificans]WBU63787.1 DUF58 domain-containing protein [Paracoccus aerodenitrificans]
MRDPSGDNRLDPRIHVDLAHLRSFAGKARDLRFLPRQRVGSVLNGRNASRLRGRGLDFEELRGYLPGDDVRDIDWKVTARTGSPHIRVFTEERDRPALIVVDQRMSMFFGSQLNMKSVTAAETAALIAFRILDQGDRVGGIVFTDQKMTEIRPQRSNGAVQSFLTALAGANASLRADADMGEPMHIREPLQTVARIAKRDHLIVIISDFDGIGRRSERLISGLSRHNDVILCPVNDPMTRTPPADLKLAASDGRLQAEIDTGNASVLQALTRLSQTHTEALDTWSQKFGIPLMPLSAAEETVPQIRKLLGATRQRP